MCKPTGGGAAEEATRASVIASSSSRRLRIPASYGPSAKTSKRLCASPSRRAKTRASLAWTKPRPQEVEGKAGGERVSGVTARLGGAADGPGAGGAIETVGGRGAATGKVGGGFAAGRGGGARTKVTESRSRRGIEGGIGLDKPVPLREASADTARFLPPIDTSIPATAPGMPRRVEQVRPPIRARQVLSPLESALKGWIP